MSGGVRVVLDTNVCLDLYHFRNPDCEALRAGLACGALEAVGDAACRAEWLRVLGYPQLALDDARRVALAADWDRDLRLLPVPIEPLPLPRCSDPDDQKFLELAATSGARWLLSRDKALLKLAKRTRRDHGFDIATPRDYALTLSSVKPV